MPLVMKSVPDAIIYANTYINVIPFAMTMQMGTFVSIYIESIPFFVITLLRMMWGRMWILPWLLMTS